MKRVVAITTSTKLHMYYITVLDYVVNDYNDSSNKNRFFSNSKQRLFK